MRPAGLIKPLLLALLLAPGAALAGPDIPLVRNAHVMDSLVAARAADRIRHECPTISGRLIKAYFKARGLKRYALDHGYSEAQIDAFLKDPAAKQEVKARAEALLAARGAKPGDGASFCAVGRAEIGAGSLIGSLLYAQ